MRKLTTLRSRMILSLTMMVFGSLTTGIAGIAAINGLHQDLGVAMQGYRQLRQLFDVGFLSAKARDAITANPPQIVRSVASLRWATQVLDEHSIAIDGPPDRWVDEAARKDCRDLLERAIGDLEHGNQNPASLNLLFARLSKVSDEVRQSITDAQTAADRKWIVMLFTIATLCATVVLIAIAIGVKQYRRVIGPMGKIGEGVRLFARGDFNRRIDLHADLEFVLLAADFNRMADELAALYRDLEAKVQEKSRQLVRSERLASLGYLAAGVAHEINNPLGIIAGYSERAMQHLGRGTDESALPMARKALTVICEEVFRCKQITERLLSLARPGGEDRGIISIATIAEAVICTLSGLGTIGQRRLTLTTESDADLRINAVEGEIKQLLLNLIFNALESTSEATGQVQVRLDQRDNGVELTVVDNGHGMTAETLERIFQPFFSQKRGQRPGTGLGLCIAHTIVDEHGGQMRAASDGPGKGSTFYVLLPAVNREPDVIAAR